jgi:hypothetical protein
MRNRVDFCYLYSFKGPYKRMRLHLPCGVNVVKIHSLKGTEAPCTFLLILRRCRYGFYGIGAK